MEKQCSCQACQARLRQHVRNHSIHITPRGSCGINRTSGRDTTPDTTMPTPLNFQCFLRSKSLKTQTCIASVDIDLKGSVHSHLWGHHIWLLGMGALAAEGSAHLHLCCGDTIFGCWAWALWQLCSGLPKYWMTTSRRIHGCRRSSKERWNCRALTQLPVHSTWPTVLQASALQKASGLIGPGNVRTRTEGTWNLNFRRIALRSKT